MNAEINCRIRYGRIELCRSTRDRMKRIGVCSRRGPPKAWLATREADIVLSKTDTENVDKNLFVGKIYIPQTKILICLITELIKFINALIKWVDDPKNRYPKARSTQTSNKEFWSKHKHSKVPPHLPHWYPTYFNDNPINLLRSDFSRHQETILIMIFRALVQKQVTGPRNSDSATSN